MSAIEFASLPNFPYQKLKREDNFLDDYERNKMILRSSRSWCRFRRLGSRKRFRIKVPSLRKFLRRKIRVVSAVRVSCAKVLKRLKESQAHLGDLFAGNYVFMQVSPTSLKYLEKSFKGQCALNGLPNSRYSLPRVA